MEDGYITCDCLKGAEKLDINSWHIIHQMPLSTTENHKPCLWSICIHKEMSPKHSLKPIIYEPVIRNTSCAAVMPSVSFHKGLPWEGKHRDRIPIFVPGLTPLDGAWVDPAPATEQGFAPNAWMRQTGQTHGLNEAGRRSVIQAYQRGFGG